jgi:hypothetical protein
MPATPDDDSAIHTWLSAGALTRTTTRPITEAGIDLTAKTDLVLVTAAQADFPRQTQLSAGALPSTAAASPKSKTEFHLIFNLEFRVKLISVPGLWRTCVT